MLPIYVLVHPIDTAAHPTYPPGWRWAVMIGDGAFSDTSRCANAGWCPTQEEATAEGDQNAATAVAAIQILSAHYRGVVPLDHDPIPAEADLERLRTV